MRTLFSEKLRKISISVVLIIGIFFCLYSLWLAYKTNNGFGFPLDDSWIHLQFARNLHDYGSFSYYKDEMTTAGSTSPLYTALLAVGFFFTTNEFLLSYALGIFALVAASYIMYKLVLLLYDNNFILALLTALLIMIEPRLQWIAISGMETTLFIALLLLVLYFYYSKKSVLLGIASGLLLWTRPEALILFAVIAIDILYRMKFVKHLNGKNHNNNDVMIDFFWIKKSGVITLIITAAYFAFNLYLSGSIFPNTFAAKLKYYSATNPNFLREAFHYFTDSHFLLPAIFTFVAICVILWKLKNRQPVLLLVPFLWMLLFFIAYWRNLPALFQNGRYLMPILPGFLLLNADGLNMVSEFVKHRFRFLNKKKNFVILVSVIILALIFQFVERTLRETDKYIDFCNYINNRQVRTAFWIRDHLPKNSIIATHDIGAIAFYTDMRIVDMVGLVSPEMIKSLMNSDSLLTFMKRKNVTHLATLQTWFPIVNNTPIFQTDPEHPEVMEVYNFIPERFHISSQRAIRLNKNAQQYILRGNPNYALELLQQSLLLDPLSAPTHFLIGKAALMIGNLKMAEERFKIVSQLHPDYPGLSEEINTIKKFNVK